MLYQKIITNKILLQLLHLELIRQPKTLNNHEY